MATGRRVGELAEATGLTVRTLHYYEQIGLLTPSGRSPAGHRIYDDADAARLYRVGLLRRLGMNLAEVQRALDDPAWDLRSAMEAHLGALDARLDATARLRSKVAGALAAGGTDLVAVLEELSTLEPPAQQRIVLLVYADIGTAQAWLVERFGLLPGALVRDGAGRVVHGEVHAGDGVIWLHPEQASYRLASPATVGATTASVAVLVDDVDAHHQRSVEAGVEVRQAPVDQDYGYRVYSAYDLEGHLWSFMRPLD
ncbi:MerR family transcriptional regulator [Cellulomonas humilata]|uniref:DNA-binding transcriptional MerR regulator n=1 Tax=Cellulomonas humilata TaxID=144055 RepID=A0ABU0EJ51_9CELL|nr:MerR family transcriptional regulator [Cellulomonas humilata]MDQ0375313.1 DNA-binding transcriptional MerR regulator [Cellulomonas humilata]